MRRLIDLALGGRRRAEAEMDREIESHLAMRAADLERAGMSPEEARVEARRRFGNFEDARRRLHAAARRRDTAVRLRDWMGIVATDMRYALRQAGRTPGVTGTAFLTLTIGIAALGAIFSYMNAIYFAALPYHDADRIVGVGEVRPMVYPQFNSMSLDAIRMLGSSSRSFERVSAYARMSPMVALGREPAQIAALGVDTSFMGMFDLRPQAGRLIGADEIVGNAAVAMISDVLWRSRFGADPSVVGRSIALGATTYRVVGVLPVDFRFPWQTDALVPIRERADSGETGVTTHFDVIAKLRRGVSRDAARSEMQVLAKQLAVMNRKAYGSVGIVVQDEMLDRKARQFLPLPSLFIGAGVFMLLIACANVANLLLARGARRQAEMAIRASMGAARSRLIGLMLTESLLIGTAAAIAGTALSLALVRLWLHLVPTSGFPSWFHLSVDWRILGFAIATVLLVTVAAGLMPARESSRFDLVRSLKAGGDGGGNRTIVRSSRRGLVIQLALSVALFIMAALLARSLQNLTTIDLGYPAASIATVQPLFDPERFIDMASRARFIDDIADRTARIPGSGIVAVRGRFSTELRGLGAPKPKRSDYQSNGVPRYPRLIPDGDTTRALEPQMNPEGYVVSDSYFSLLGLRTRAGRSFSNGDVIGAPAAVVISRTLAKALWGTTNPIGHTMQKGSDGDLMTVIGVVDDVRDLRGGRRGYNTEPRLLYYLSVRQAFTHDPELLVKPQGDVLAFRSRVVEIVREIDPMMMLLRGTTLASQFEEAFLVTKVFGSVIVALAVSALALSIIGIYGVISFGVVQRTREIGVRAALGGTSSDILRMITGEGLRFAAIGLVIGLVLSLGLSRIAKVMLFDVSPLDPLAYAAVSVGFGFVALIACYLPARKATRIDPMIALRAE